MPVFTAIGVALGATVAASAGAGIGAFGVGLAATALGAAAIGTSMNQSARQAAGQADQARQAKERSERIEREKLKAEADIKLADQKAADKASDAARRIKGRTTKTILTSARGATDAEVAKKTLLGA